MNFVFSLTLTSPNHPSDYINKQLKPSDYTELTAMSTKKTLASSNFPGYYDK